MELKISKSILLNTLLKDKKAHAWCESSNKL